MKQTTTARITKSDFLLYCEAPRHLWTKKHGQIEVCISDFDQHLAEDGNRVGALAQEFLASVFLPQHSGDQLLLKCNHSHPPVYQKAFNKYFYQLHPPQIIQEADNYNNVLNQAL